MSQILTTGLTGLVGSRISSVLSNYHFTDLSLSTGVDITDKAQVEKIFGSSSAEYVLHLAAVADVDKCEEEKDLAFKVNVHGTRNIVKACKKFNKKIIHFSTDFVFGNELFECFEESERKAVNYYSETKILAEDEVRNGLNKNQWIILRISHPYKLPVYNEPKKSFFQRMYETLSSGQKLKAIEDFYSCPTFIDDIAFQIDKLIEKDSFGIFNCVGSSLITGVEEAIKICEIFGFDKTLIEKTKHEEFFASRAKRPKRLNLNNDKIEKETGIKMKTFKEGLIKIKQQMNET